MPGFVHGLVHHAAFSEQWAGYVASAEHVGALIAGLCATALLRLVAWRRLAAIGIALYVAGNLAGLITETSSEFAMVRALAGLGSGLMIPIVWSALGTTRRPEFNFGILIAASQLFGAVAIFLLPLIFATGGIRGYCTSFAALGLAAVWCLSRLPAGRDQTRDSASRDDRSVEPADVPRSASGPARIGIGIASFGLYTLAIGGLWAYLSLIGAAAGLDERTVANAVTISQIAGLFGALAASFASIRIGRQRLLVVGLLASAVGAGAVGAAHSAATFTLAVVAFNALWCFVLPFFVGTLGAISPGGRLVALAQPIQAAGYGIGPLIAAVVVGWSGYPALVALSAGSLLAALLTIMPTATRRSGTTRLESSA